MTDAEFKPGARVVYKLGGTVPSLRGKLGTAKGIGRNGWILVDFDYGEEGVKCAGFNLEPAPLEEKA
jgi:hypothetical protein